MTYKIKQKKTIQKKSKGMKVFVIKKRGKTEFLDEKGEKVLVF